MENGAEIIALGNSLYLATSDALFEVKPDSGETQILASSRRQPAVHEVDTWWGPEAWVYGRPDGKLGILGTNALFTFTTATGKWDHKWALPETRFYRRALTSSGMGAELLLMGMSRDYLMGLWGDAMESLLEHFSGKQFRGKVSWSGAGAPKWEWPQQFPLEDSCILAEEDALWVFAPRRLYQLGERSEEPVSFEDDRQGTLFYFITGSREPAILPLSLQRDGQPVDPFERRWLRVPPGVIGFWSAKPSWLSTPQGLTLICQRLPGHWLISKAPPENNKATLSQPAPAKQNKGSQP